MRRRIMVTVALCCFGCSSMSLTEAEAVRIATKDAARRDLLPNRYSVAVDESESIVEMAPPRWIYLVTFSQPTSGGSQNLYRYSINKRSGEVEGIIDSRRNI